MTQFLNMNLVLTCCSDLAECVSPSQFGCSVLRDRVQRCCVGVYLPQLGGLDFKQVSIMDPRADKFL